MKFKEYKLQDICKVVDSLHKTPSYENKGVPMIRVTDLKDGYFSIPNEVKLVSQEVFSEFSKKHIPEFNDILMSRVGSYGITSIIKTREKFCLGQNTIVITDFSEEVLSEYLFYYLISSYGKELIEKNVSGSTQKTISLKSINNFNILLPEKSYQNEVINILSSFYKKIEVNNKIITNLEEQAQAIFKSWFVDFEPFQDGNFVESELGMIPEGWEVKPIGKLFDFDIGGGWGKEDPKDKYNLPAYVIRGTDIPESKKGNYNKNNLRFHTKSNLEKRRLKPGDIIFESSGGSSNQDLGRMLYISQEFLDVYDHDVICASFCKLIRVDDSINRWYVYNLLEYSYNKRYLTKYEVKSTGISNFSFSIFKNDFKIVFPNNKILENYYKITAKNIELIAKLELQNKKLAEIREALLPKLMSGEIDVSNIKIKGEEVKNE